MNFRVNSELRDQALERFGQHLHGTFWFFKKQDKMDINRAATGLILSTIGFFLVNNHPTMTQESVVRARERRFKHVFF